MKLVLLLLVALALAAPAFAKDVCLVDDDGRHYRFENLKLPKKEGKLFPFVGSIRIVPAEVQSQAYGAFSGAVMLEPGLTDTWLISFFSQTPNVAFSIRLSLDPNFNGGGLGDFDGDFTLESSFGVNPIDCEESTLP